MKKIIIIILIFGMILISACGNNNDLSQIDYNEGGGFTYNGKSYIYLGSAGNLKRGKKLAYMKDESGIVTEVREIKNFSSDQWLLTISKNLMGDWALFGEESVENIPAKFAEGNIISYEQEFIFNSKTFQLFSRASLDLKTQSKVGDIIIEQEKISIFSIKGYNQNEWLMLASNDEGKEYYLYKESGLNEIPIEFYKYALNEDIIQMEGN